MHILRAFTAALSSLGLVLLQPAIAHSTQRNPLSYVTRIDDARIHTPSHRVHALSSFELTFLLHDRRQKIRLTLTPNHDILSEDAAIQYLGPDGTLHSIEPIDRLDHRVFKGDAFTQHEDQSEWTNAGWARIAIHRDGLWPVFEGAFRVDGVDHHVQTYANYRQTGVRGDPEVQTHSTEDLIVWRDSDVIGMGHEHEHDELKRDVGGRTTCTSDELLYNRDDDHPVYKGLDVRDLGSDMTAWSMHPRALFGREIDGTTGGNGAGVNLASTIGSTAGCPLTRKVALIGVATDCTYTAQFNSSSAVRANIIQQINTASQLYESTFNISLGIQNLTISNETCPSVATTQAPWNIACSKGVTITDRLNLFSKWRGQFNDTNAYWTLLSTCNTDAAVGLAWLGQVCVAGAQTSSSNGGNETIAAANVVVRTSTEWQVIAHETGHTFGAVHDCVQGTCNDGTVTKQMCCPLSADSCNANGQFIMNPSTGSSITKFSPCSVGNICSAIGRNSVKIGCLTNNRDVVTITGSQCGNGIVESGEDCDCGGPSGCGNNPCCNPTTCKFTANSVCDPANEECCTPQCGLASNGTVCRPSSGTCDPEETCSGASANCPADVTAPDGTACGSSGGGLSCASGQCTSRDLQCKTIMGGLTRGGNDTTACNPQGCQLSCTSPEFGSSGCLTMRQNFLDGTPCQGGGKCNNGQCDGASLSNEIGQWISDNKQIVVPVACAVGGLAALAGISCCVHAWRRRSRGKRSRGGSPRGATRRRAPPPPPAAGWYGPQNMSAVPVMTSAAAAGNRSRSRSGSRSRSRPRGDGSRQQPRIPAQQGPSSRRRPPPPPPHADDWQQQLYPPVPRIYSARYA